MVLRKALSGFWKKTNRSTSDLWSALRWYEKTRRHKVAAVSRVASLQVSHGESALRPAAIIPDRFMSKAMTMFLRSVSHRRLSAEISRDLGLTAPVRQHSSPRQSSHPPPPWRRPDRLYATASSKFRVLDLASAKTVSDATGNLYLTETAQGVFVIVTLSVTNIGNEPQNYFGQNQKLIDTAGREYEVSTAAHMYLNSDVGIMGQIDPGNSIQVKLPFDVPPDSRFTMLELHDSMFSGGVKLALPAN
jgi:hypothetical protein